MEGRAVEVVVMADRLRVRGDGHGSQLQLQQLAGEDEEEARRCLKVDVDGERSVRRGDLLD